MGKPVTMLMLDLDHFKSINDRFGHAIGDEVLRVFANAARSNMRGSDLVGRLSGEEFAVIVAEPMQFVARICERLRVSFETAGIQIGEHAIGATVSIGAATSHEPATDIATLIARADAALYRAKHDGGNRLYAADAEPPPDQDTRPLAAVRSDQAIKPTRLSQGKAPARRAKSIGLAVLGENATSRLPSAR